jgi:hypothetical protein
MNYNDLKKLVRYLKETTKCPNCKKNFLNKNIIILAILPSEAVIQLDCNKCRCATLVTAGKNLDSLATGINKNDILDMHNFLSRFNGDFKNLFKSSK